MHYGRRSVRFVLESSTGRLALAVGVILIAVAIGFVLRLRNGRQRSVSPQGPRLSDVLGAGTPAPASPSGVTVVQVSSAVCSPCRATARTWNRVAGSENHVEIDIEQRPDVAERLSVWRTPTSFLFDRDGALVARVDGAPNVDQATRAFREAGATA